MQMDAFIHLAPEYNALRPILELSVVIPAAVLCFLPLKGKLKRSAHALVSLGLPFLVLWTVAGGLICNTLSWKSNTWLAPSLVAFAVFYCWISDLSVWKTISVFLAVCAVFSCLTNLATTADALLAPENHSPWFTLPGVAIHILLCWAVLACVWYPATHAARWLLSEWEMPTTWYVFWLLPVVFIGINIFIQPLDYNTLYTGRMMIIYPVMTFILLCLLLFLYLMFYLMARGLEQEMRLERENEILQMQSAQYRLLQKNMEETRSARHDLRHHFVALQGYIQSGDLQAVSNYVHAHIKALPLDAPQLYCKNLAVNAVLHYYAEQAMQNAIDWDISVQMGDDTVIPETELCSLIGNLLENALEACASIPDDRFIQVRICQNRTSHLVITVDNSCPESPQWESGHLRSTKHKGFGFGTQSIQVIRKALSWNSAF